MKTIRSILDTDLYKITQGQLVFNQFSNGVVEYEFFNRGGHLFTPDVVDAFEEEVRAMADLSMNDEEFTYLQSIRFLKPTFLEWFRNYRFNPKEVLIERTNIGDLVDLKFKIVGPWYRTIYWEVPLMAALSELSFRNRTRSQDWVKKIAWKRAKLISEEVSWIDFGTRRRASFDVQDKVVQIMSSRQDFKGDFFRGTSNVYLAKKHNVKAQGTIAHEVHQAMQAKYGIMMSNQMTLEHWCREYDGDLGVMLPDTLTTDFFMQHLSRRDAKLYDGARQDSGDLIQSAEKYIAKLITLDIDPKSKILVPSDSLNDDSAIEFANHFKGRVKGVTAGIGTFLTNDCGFKPLNIVVKMVRANFGFGMTDVVKLSDVDGKHTGNSDRVLSVKKELGFV